MVAEKRRRLEKEAEAKRIELTDLYREIEVLSDGKREIADIVSESRKTHVDAAAKALSRLGEAIGEPPMPCKRVIFEAATECYRLAAEFEAMLKFWE
ncbi:MAG: hypothetical protein M0R66_03810 [Candidatus Omnitrophica bacterium]|nr:hypothetical protein [Candidatus Omnitrophota bacterium]